MTLTTLHMMTKANGVVMKTFTAVHALEQAEEFVTKTPPVGLVAWYVYDRQKQLLKHGVVG